MRVTLGGLNDPDDLLCSSLNFLTFLTRQNNLRKRLKEDLQQAAFIVLQVK